MRVEAAGVVFLVGGIITESERIKAGSEESIRQLVGDVVVFVGSLLGLGGCGRLLSRIAVDGSDFIPFWKNKYEGEDAQPKITRSYPAQRAISAIETHLISEGARTSEWFSPWAVSTSA